MNTIYHRHKTSYYNLIKIKKYNYIIFNTFNPHTERKSSLTEFAVTDNTVNGIETEDKRVKVSLRLDTSGCFNKELICKTAIFPLSCDTATKNNNIYSISVNTKQYIHLNILFFILKFIYHIAYN